MYANIMVAVDNSECSNYAVDLAVDLAALAGARLTGNHVYAARLHDTRFRDLEPGLPERYQSEAVLQRQRAIHDGLIGGGLQIISDSYLAVFEEKGRAAGLSPARKTPEGRNYEELLRDARESAYDLILVGAHGLGRVKRAILGSVCERVARLAPCDVLVVRDNRSLRSGGLLVALDGSAHSFAALRTALALGQASGSPVAAVAAYDPFFHSLAFKSIAGVLTPESAKLFRFPEQEKLHDEIIDGGLRNVYNAHLVRAQQTAGQAGIALDTTVLEGKPYDAIASYVEELRPALLLVGRLGIHHRDGVTLGSTAENLLRFAACNVLVVGGGNVGASENIGAAEMEECTATEASAPPGIRWSQEAEQRLQRVPWFARKMARRRIEDFARGQGHVEITLQVYERARQHFGM